MVCRLCVGWFQFRLTNFQLKHGYLRNVIFSVNCTQFSVEYNPQIALTSLYSFLVFTGFKVANCIFLVISIFLLKIRYLNNQKR